MKSFSLLCGLLPLAGTAYAAALEGIHQRQSNWTVGQTVQTSSGPVTGHASANASAKGVSEYLGIPFGQAPIGELRFAAPKRFEGSAPLNGSTYGYSCPVRSSNSSLPSPAMLDAANVTAAGLATLAVFSNAGARYNEDCLYLNVWTKPQVGEAKKAVLLWIYGGGFSSGSSSIPGYIGANLVEEQDVIVVSINYRLSILGFPGNPNGTANLGLLDQRLAVEWVRDNIANFGGDPERITLFGQSAGGASIDLYAYAWAKDPIVAGLIPESGNVYGWNIPNSQAFATPYWYNVTATLGCGNETSPAADVLSCMRTQSSQAILNAVPQLSGARGILGAFGPTADEVVVFTDITNRKPANVPILIGSTDYEVGYFRTQFGLNNLFYPDNYWNVLNLQAFTCPAGLRANASVSDDIPVWRYRYFGVFPNLKISDDAGAWHGSEMAMLFNTAPTSIQATTEQISIGKYIRGAWTTFAKSPVTGLTAYGWPRYDPSKDTLVRIAYENITGPNLINPRRYDADCNLIDVRNTNESAIPDLPDAGASITPTGTGNGNAAPTATGGAGATGSPQPANAGWKVGGSVSMSLVGVVFALLL